MEASAALVLSFLLAFFPVGLPQSTSQPETTMSFEPTTSQTVRSNSFSPGTTETVTYVVTTSLTSVEQTSSEVTMTTSLDTGTVMSTFSSSLSPSSTSLPSSTSSPSISSTTSISEPSTSSTAPSTSIPTSSTMSMPPPGTNPPGESPQHSGIITATAVVVSLLVVVLTALVVVIVLFCLMKRKRKSGGMRVMSGWESNTEFTDSQRTTLHGEHLIQLSTLSGSQQALLTGDNGTPVSTPVIRRKNVVESHPVAIDEFALYVESTDDEDLKAEWREIPQRTHDLAAQSLMNPLNNRYTNILPYDKNRVHLKEPNSDGNDYINASYIDGYNVQKSYICAQGPLQRTVDDFWQVVWDHQVNIIVMLTNFIEGQKNKCAEYFPIKENTKVFAKMHMVVVNKSVKVYKDYTLRIFSLENNKTKKSLTVHHFHYTAWPDFGVPKDPSGVLAVLHHARVTRMSHEPAVPVIVHCSAGVGRTGTYLSLDMLMDQVESEGETCVIDIKTLVKNMRDQRNLMVQAPDQYVFIHKAFREHYLVGSTIMSSGEMKKKVEEMSPVKRHSGISQFQEQYEALDYITECYQTKGTKCESVDEMLRYPARAPYEGKVININPLIGDDSNTFINASFVPDYYSSKSVIVAQAPMATTVQYFWTLIYEMKTPLIVLLCDFKEKEEEHSIRFWPENADSSVSYEGYKITLLSEEETPKYHNIYTMSVHPQEPGLEPQKVTLFHLTSWPEGQAPPTYDLLHLLSEIKAFKQSANHGPVVLACNDGLGRSCLFSALWTLSYQLDKEDQVDVVTTFKSIRASRPGALPSLDYFIQCYHLLLQYKEPTH